MRSPFPGMDPYLEQAASWGGFHSRFINTLSDVLGEQLPPTYIVNIEVHVYIEDQETEESLSIVPDAYLVTAPEQGIATATAGGAITVPTLIEPIAAGEIRTRWIEIVDAESRKVVTTIELLSPFNKASHPKGLQAFLHKRRSVMLSSTHWVEIDLLRGGGRPDEVTGKSAYYTLLKRAEERTQREVWFFDLRDGLPTIAVPLKSHTPDLPLDLQYILERTYERGLYARSINYMQPVPPPRLRPADQAWAEAQIREWRAAHEQAPS